MMELSVVMAVYCKDQPKWVDEALNSILDKISTINLEIVLVVDGPVSQELNELITFYETKHLEDLRVIRIPENRGLGNALKVGVTAAKYELIARMDSDDISQPGRFEKQLTFMSGHPDVDIVGGQISEFIGSVSNIVGIREVPCSNDAIYAWMKKRCPFNHMTVMFRKSKVLEVGNYKDWHYNEDYYLWIRMAEAGYKFANLPDTLVNVRVGKDMYARRGGWKYFKSEKGLQDYMLRRNFISFPRYIFNVLIRFGVQIMLPNKIRGLIFQKLFRNKNEADRY